MKIKMLSGLLAALMLLCACGADAGQETGPLLSEPELSNELVPGFATTEITLPNHYVNPGSLQSTGDSLIFSAETPDGQFAVLRYDTISGTWSDWILETGEAENPSLEVLSPAGDTVWIRLYEGYTDREVETGSFGRKLHYYLMILDMKTGKQQLRRLDFWRNDNTGHDPYLTGLVALDDQRALILDDEKVRLMNREGEILENLSLPLMGFPGKCWIGDQLYLSTSAGLCPFDIETLHCGEALEELLWEPVYSSRLGRILVTRGRVLYEYAPESGELSEVFNWMDVAMRYSMLWTAYEGLENSKGELYYLSGGKLDRVTPGMVPAKKTLILGCFADAGAYGYEYSETDYTCPESLLDAVMRFNQTDPEYRVEIRPMVFHDEAERSRLLMELANSRDMDVLDTSLLPPGAVDRQLLVDLLPYLDEDMSLSREDFIPGLLAAQTVRGGLYEYTDKFTLLTVLGAEHLGIEPGDWSLEEAMELMSREGSGPSMTREELVTLFCWAATAEFMDPATGECGFDSLNFEGWLQILKAIPTVDPEGPFFSGDDCQWLLTNDFAGDAGFVPRMTFRDEAVVLGFPGTGGCGSYFMKLLPPEGTGRVGELRIGETILRTTGCNTSLGILASSENRSGAWRFVRTFMEGEEEPYLSDGIPVFREAFERALENSLHRPQSNVNTYESFNEKDADVMRKLVYEARGLVIRDDAVMNTMRSEINAFLSGQKSAGEAARQIQSRMSLYLAEQSE